MRKATDLLFLLMHDPSLNRAQLIESKRSIMMHSFEFIDTLDWCRLAEDSREFLRTKKTYLKLFEAEKFIFKPEWLKDNPIINTDNPLIGAVSTNGGFSAADLISGKTINGSVVAHLEKTVIKDSSLLVLVRRNLSLTEGYGDINWAEYQLNTWPSAHNFPQCVIGIDQFGRTLKKRIKIYSIDTKIREIPMEAVYLSVRAQDKNIYHWLFETLVRLSALEVVPALRDLPIIVRDPLTPYQAETLRLLGVENKIIITNGESFEVKELYFPSIPAPSILHSGAINWLRENLLKGCRDDIKKNNRRIYISRSDSNRKVINEDKVFQILSEYGFEKLTMSELTPLEQIDAFRAAEVVVLPHGAAGSNLLFSSKNCRVIELHSPNWLNSCYMCLCAILGMKYQFLIGKQVGNDLDYEVDLGRLQASVLNLQL